ncbi:hypothetical protein M0R88_10355 [Halorussus gelatinilyticus]|uniref:Uncharacterized protein n=1 Tax=Halorussus gelatinilyticus TaxID=2937524 RepID=A0A8U0IFE5_9EURY|nr:hypothetical protein [Halorussus gelatinilyticus]UPV98931.1 hypothetical protein M0R88_10355 [Halorussus gelatinilyticus]
MKRRLVLGILIIGLCLSVGAPTALTESYSLTVSNSVDTPTSQVTVDGTQHTVSSIAKTAPGSTLTVSVSAPEATDYTVQLRNRKRQITTDRDGTGDGQVTFDFTGYKPGSYMLLLYKNGEYKDIFPVVVSGYDISVDAPKTATSGSTVTVDISATKSTDVESPNAVYVVFTTDGKTKKVQAAESGSDSYQASVSLEDIPTGDHRLYAYVQGSDTAFKEGKKEILGISNGVALTVTDKKTTTSTSSSNSGAEETSTTTADTTKTTVTTQSTTTRTTSKNTTSTTSAQTPTTTPDISSTTTATETTTSIKTTSSSLITPNKTATDTATSTNSEKGVPGFDLMTAIGTLLIAGVFLHRR